MKKKTLALFSIVILIFGSLFFCQEFFKKPSNIIALSVCSLRKDALSIYGLQTKKYYLDELSERSLVLKQAISSDGVRGLSRHLLKALSEDQFFLKDYNLLSDSAHDAVSRLLRFDNPEIYFKNLSDKIEIALKENKPFALFPHIELLHFPFGESDSSELISFLDSQQNISRKEISERLPFFLALVPYEKLVSIYPSSFLPMSPEDALNFSFKVFKNPERLRKWKQSATFHDDRKVLLRFYHLKLKVLDTYLNHLLKGRENDSYIYIVGCHGQPFLEQEDFLHGNAIDEGTANIPAFIHLPGMSKPEFLGKQVGMEKIVQTIKELAPERLSNNKFIALSSKILSDEFMLQFDCKGQRFGVRDNGKYKYMRDFSSGEIKFFELQNDPQMQDNLSEELTSEQVEFYEKKLYDLFLNKLTSNQNDLPSASYCPFQIQINSRIK